MYTLIFYCTTLFFPLLVQCSDPHAVDDLLISNEIKVKLLDSNNSSTPSTPSSTQKITWQEFKQKYGRNISSKEEEEERKAAFESAQDFIEKHNQKHAQGLVKYKLKTNNLADMPFEEYRKRNNHKFANKNEGSTERRKRYAFEDSDEQSDHENGGDIPDRIDWRDKGYVTEIKMQGNCGCCWAFSSVGALEAQYKKATGHLKSFSEQQMVDCATEEPNAGCNGGNMDSAFNYVRRHGGLATEKEYPFEAQDGNCRSSREDRWKNVRVTGIRDLPAYDEQALKVAVAKVGPVSVIIDASHQSFQFYSEGIYDDPDCNPDNLDHGVLIVGYGSDSSDGDYWLVKNSWAEDWGEKGYVRIARNKNNLCGIASSASYPIVELGDASRTSMDDGSGGGDNGNSWNDRFHWRGDRQDDESEEDDDMKPFNNFDMPVFVDDDFVKNHEDFSNEDGDGMFLVFD